MKSDVEQFNEYWDPVCGELLHHLIRKTNRQDAEDILQDIAYLAYGKIRHFRGKEPLDFKRWVYGVAAKKVLKWYSKKSRAAGMLQFCDRSGGVESLVDELILSERKEILRMYLEELSVVDKYLIELRHYQELPYDEIARIMGKSPSALMTRHTRILRKLLHLIIEHEKNME